jgi:hypothetical protein
MTRDVDCATYTNDVRVLQGHQETLLPGQVNHSGRNCVLSNQTVSDSLYGIARLAIAQTVIPHEALQCVFVFIVFGIGFELEPADFINAEGEVKYVEERMN